MQQWSRASYRAILSSQGIATLTRPPVTGRLNAFRSCYLKRFGGKVPIIIQHRSFTLYGCHQDSRPSKRPRLAPLFPDGFVSTSKVPKQVKHVAPKFTSGFASTSTVGIDTLNRSRTISTAQRPDFGVSDPKPAAKLRSLKPPFFDRPGILAGPSDSKNKVFPSEKAAVVTAFRHALPALPHDLNPPTAMGKGGVQQRTAGHMLHNPPILQSSTRSASLKPLPMAPPRPSTDRAPPPLSPSKLKTISTTHVARATDPRTENGSVELLSIFLRQRGTEFLSADEKELRRGLEQTPEKNKGGKGQRRYIRCADVALHRSKQFPITQFFFQRRPCGIIQQTILAKQHRSEIMARTNRTFFC